MLDEYYEQRGWNLKEGLPTNHTMRRVNLDDVVEDLAKHGIVLPK